MKHNIIYVDDDEYLLKSFRRLFSQEDYTIFTFSDPNEALKFGEVESVSVVVSDFKMPLMNGIEFLQQFKLRFPDTIRILVTAFSDINTAMDAINKGEVYRYLGKPWRNEEIRVLIKQAVQLYEIKAENVALQKMTQKQMEELEELNRNLEKKVEEKSKEIIIKNKKLDESFYETIRLVLKLLEIKEPRLGGHSKRVSLIAKMIAEEMKLSEEEKRNIEIAGILHDIGKIGFPENIFKKSFMNLNYEEKKIYMQHPVIGNLTLSYIPSLKEAAKIIMHHHEDYSGTGFPNKLKGEDIPLGSRILRIADTFDLLTNPYNVDARKLNMDDAYKKIEEGTVTLFDQNIVRKFKNVLDFIKMSVKEKKKVVKLSPEEIKEGMVIAADVKTVSGILIFKKDEVVNFSMLQRMREYVKIDPLKEKISVIKK